MESPLTYAKMTGFATTDGQLFEVNLAALLFLRGLNSGMDFQLATNVDGAGAMDDVVFRFKPSTESDSWTTMYVQLKHKETVKVSRKLLRSKKEGFYLVKYFKSYLEIKKAMAGAEKGTLFDGEFERSVFLIFTNAKANLSLGEGRCETLCQAEKFVWCGFGRIFSFENDEDILKCLGECGDEGNEFLGRLQLFCGQPNADGLEAAVETELGNVDRKITEGVDLKNLFESFLRSMKAWWEKSNEVLHKGNDILQYSVLDVTSQQTEKEYRLDIDFEEAVLNGLRVAVSGDCKVFVVQSCDSSFRLSLTKLCQAFGGQSLVLDCEGLLANNSSILAQSRKGNFKSLIICTSGWISSQHADYFNFVKDLTAIPNTPPIVFLTNDISGVVTVLKDESQDSVKSLEDNFLFSQLVEVSREKILAREVSLQGYLNTLGGLLDDTPGSADRVLDACSVVEILECDGSLTLGSALSDGIGYYVDRSLEQATVVKPSVFQDGALQGNFTVRVLQSEASVDLERDKANILESSGLTNVTTTNEAGLFETAVNFLSSFIHNVNEKNVVGNLHQSHLVADKNNLEVFIGSNFRLGSFECNSIVLRFGQQDAVTALRVRISEYSSQASFLFVSDKTSESDIRKLSEFHQSKHLLSLKDGTLRWIKSHGDIESIRPHIDEDQVSTFAPENAMDVEDRLVLVCAEPGMGKSTLMARLAKNTKEAYPHYFVFMITLNDHSVLFSQDTHTNALEFLCSANNIDSHLHRSLLKHALEVSGDVVVLFDGYDEISPKYIEQSCDLLSSLMKETKVSKIWMTSRNSVKITLEAKISQFSAKLREFNRMDQESFLRKFLKGKSQLLEAEFVQFIDQLIEKTSQAVRDKDKNFMGIPLQTQMLAEVYEDHVTGSAEKTKLPDKLDLHVLLQQFVDKKYSIYFREKLKVFSNNTNEAEFLKMSKKGFVKSHARAALISILDDDDIKTLRMGSVIKKSIKFFKEIQSGSYKTGFIDRIVNDKPRFIHRVFAEYFVAKWISKKFEDNRKFIKSKLFTDDFAVVRNVFDRILAKDCPLHTAVVNEDLEEVRTLLKREHVEFNEKDDGGRTVLHLAAGLGTSENLEENKRRGEILDLLIGKTTDFNIVDDVLDGSPLKYADITRSWIAADRFLPCSDNEQFTQVLKDITNRNMVDTVFDLDLHNLLGFCLDNGLHDERCSEGKSQFLFRACKKGSVKVASLLLKINPGINEVSGQSSLFLHRASENGHLEIVRLLQKHHVSTPDNDIIHKITASQKQKLVDYINIVDEDGATAIHYAARNGHSHIIRCLIEEGGVHQTLTRTNITPLHTAARFKHPDTVRILLEALDEADRGAAVNSRAEHGDSVLLRGASYGCVQCVELLVKAGGKMTQTNDVGRTPLMEAVTGRHHEVVSYLLNNFSAKREGTSLIDYIDMADRYDETAIYLAAQKGLSEVTSLLITLGGNPRRRVRNETALHMAAINKHPKTLRVLLETVDVADRASVVNSIEENERTVLMCAVKGGCVKCVAMLMQAGGKCAQADDCGYTPFIEAAHHGHQETINFFLKTYSAEREGFSKQEFVNMKDNAGMTAIHHAALRGYSISILPMTMGDDLRSHKRHYSRPLQMVPRFKDPGVVRTFLEALDGADQTLTANSCDMYGNSVLMCAAWSGCVDTVDLLIKAGGRLTQVSLAGHTPLMFAAFQGDDTISRYLLKVFSSEREGMSYEDYINMADKDGKTAIHYAVRGHNLKVIRFLIEQGGDPHSCDNYKISPLHLAARLVNVAAVDYLLGTLGEADRALAVNSREDLEGNSVLMCTALSGSEDCLQLLVQAGGKLSQTNNNQRSPLMEAAFQNDLSLVEDILIAFDPVREGMSKRDYITMEDKDGNSAFDLASSECREILQTFLCSLLNNTSCHFQKTVRPKFFKWSQSND